MKIAISGGFMVFKGRFWEPSQSWSPGVRGFLAVGRGHECLEG